MTHVDYVAVLVSSLGPGNEAIELVWL